MPTVLERAAKTGFEVLVGHTTAGTALVVSDYPYGFTLRTQIRYWLETCEKGAKEGSVRFVSQTMNPDTGRWNRLKPSTYADWGWMVRDHRTGHVGWHAMSAYDPQKGIAKLKAMGLWDQLPSGDRDDLMDAVGVTRRHAPDYCAEWDATVAKVREAVRTHGTPDDLYAKAGFAGPPKVYRPDYDLALAVVRADEFGEYTLPDPL